MPPSTSASAAAFPLSNTNQLWGLLWGTLVFGELRRSGMLAPAGHRGSLIMAIGAAAVALATTGDTEHEQWRDAAEREARRYGVDLEWVRARLVGTASGPGTKRTWIDWTLVAISTALFVFAARLAEAPALAMDLRWVVILCIVTVALLALRDGCCGERHDSIDIMHRARWEGPPRRGSGRSHVDAIAGNSRRLRPVSLRSEDPERRTRCTSQQGEAAT